MLAAIRISGSRRVESWTGPGRSRSIAPQLVMGLLIIVVGVLFTLENLGFIDAARLPTVLAGGPHRGRAHEAVAGGRGGARCTDCIFFFAGVWLLLESMSIVSISLWDLWPVLLIFAGGSMVWRGITVLPGERARCRHPLDRQRRGGARRASTAATTRERSAAAI